MKSAIAVHDIELGASYRRIPGASRISDMRFRDAMSFCIVWDTFCQ